MSADGVRFWIGVHASNAKLMARSWWARRFPCPTCGTAHKRRPWYVPRWDEDKVRERLGFPTEGRCGDCGSPVAP